MSKRRVLIPLDGSLFSGQILHVVRDYFRPEDVDLVLIRVATPLLVAAEARSYAGLLTEQTHMSIYGTYSAQQEQLWAISAQERDTYRTELQSELEHDAERLRAQGYRVTTEVHFGEPAQRIIDFVNDMKIDVVAMTTHGRTGLGRLVLGSVTERVLRGVHVPVLLWRSPAKTDVATAAAETLATRLANREPLRITVATDGSTFTRRAVQLAKQLTEQLQAQLTLLVTAGNQVDAAESQQRMSDATALIADLGAKAQAVPLVGYTDEVILNYVGNNPVDLLIIGAFHDRGAGSPQAIGVTAHRLVQQVPTSILLMKGEQLNIKRILVAAALADNLIVKVAVQLAQQIGAQVDLLHVLPKPAASYLGTDGGGELPLATVLAQRTNLSSTVRTWIEQLSHVGGSEEQIHLMHGEALQAVLEFARSDKYDLLIIGSQSGPGHFLGSVANGIVQFSDQSVLLVRTEQS